MGTHHTVWSGNHCPKGTCSIPPSPDTLKNNQMIHSSPIQLSLI